jgi:hypothetical protein
MIETTYDPLCETFHFASRNIGFVFAAFGPVEARNKMAKFAPAPWRWPLWGWLRSAAPWVGWTFPIRRRGALVAGGLRAPGGKSCAKEQLSH